MAGGTPASGIKIIAFSTTEIIFFTELNNVRLLHPCTGGYGAVYKETPHAKQGDLGSKLPGEEATVEWTVGQEVTVAWTIQVITLYLLSGFGLKGK